MKKIWLYITLILISSLSLTALPFKDAYAKLILGNPETSAAYNAGVKLNLTPPGFARACVMESVTQKIILK